MKRTVAYYQTSRPLRIFLSYYRPHIHLFLLDMTCALIICLIDLAFPYASRWCLNNLLPDQAYRTFFLIIGKLIPAGAGLQAYRDFEPGITPESIVTEEMIDDEKM